PLLAVVPLLFQPAIIRKPISTNTATPAIQPHIPPVLSSRRTTGSLNRGSGRTTNLREPKRSGDACGEPPGSPKNEEKSSKKDRQAGGLRPMFYGSADAIGDR